MAISVVAPVSPAIEQTKQILFRPIALGKWFVLGFCAWLAQLGEGGGGINFRIGVPGPAAGPGPAQGPAPAPPPAPPDLFRQAMDWVQANLGLVIGIVLAVVLGGIAIGLLLTWLKSRGTFLFL